MKVCSQCSMMNADELSACAGCGADISNAPVRAGFNVSMFGSSPISRDTKPLEKASSDFSSQYGSKPSQQAVGKPDDSGASFDLGSLAGSSGPKKPWE